MIGHWISIPLFFLLCTIFPVSPYMYVFDLFSSPTGNLQLLSECLHVNPTVAWKLSWHKMRLPEPQLWSALPFPHLKTAWNSSLISLLRSYWHAYSEHEFKRFLSNKIQSIWFDDVKLPECAFNSIGQQSLRSGKVCLNKHNRSK